jgi:hypothetical protein
MRTLERSNTLFNKNNTEKNRPGLEKAIDDALLELAGLAADTEEYNKVLDKLERLYKLRAPEPEPTKPVSMDTIVAVAGNLAGIILIINHERVHVIGTKALGFVGKFR